MNAPLILRLQQIEGVGSIDQAPFRDGLSFPPVKVQAGEEVVSAAIEAGATTVNIPDTVGYTVPSEFDRLFRYLKEHVAGIDDITFSDSLFGHVKGAFTGADR